MKTTFRFQHVDNLAPWNAPALHVHAFTQCGLTIWCIATILEPRSSNPCIIIPKPIGLSTLTELKAAMLKELANA